mmetsp:Transcript_7663/g.24623  ORF Transcript_7663/g.24623 Transcript_7663/m.24623 type:complete len:308 (+) Transcript_7663:119-1042(+)
MRAKLGGKRVRGAPRRRCGRDPFLGRQLPAARRSGARRRLGRVPVRRGGKLCQMGFWTAKRYSWDCAVVGNAGWWQVWRRPLPRVHGLRGGGARAVQAVQVPSRRGPRPALHGSRSLLCRVRAQPDLGARLHSPRHAAERCASRGCRGARGGAERRGTRAARPARARLAPFSRRPAAPLQLAALAPTRLCAAASAGPAIRGAAFARGGGRALCSAGPQRVCAHLRLAHAAPPRPAWREPAARRRLPKLAHWARLRRALLGPSEPGPEGCCWRAHRRGGQDLCCVARGDGVSVRERPLRDSAAADQHP